MILYKVLDMQVYFLLMDFRKAFDAISHNILPQKLYHYGLCSSTHSLIESYLNARKQCVSNNNYDSVQKPIEIGVPQGSILGPLLYLIYVNYISNALSFKPRLFADDTCLVITGPSISDLEKTV